MLQKCSIVIVGQSRIKMKRTSFGRKPTIIVAEDDKYISKQIAESLEDEGFIVLQARSGSQVLRAVESGADQIDLILLDIMMPVGSELSSSDAHAGYDTGYAVARQVKHKYPHIKLLALSGRTNPELVNWFFEYGAGYICKPALMDDIVAAVKEALRKGRHRRKPTCFIVHGHDSTTVDDLKKYLRNELHFPKVTVLREQPSLGRTIIEKFEDEAQKVNIAFVLLTPDDTAAPASAPDEVKRRARQNVIFELGYFFAKLQRRTGSVILLHKGPLELPSDLSGVVYIDITDGIRKADQQIRRELIGWM
jgi:DNA-binding response OmpR family regulator